MVSLTYLNIPGFQPVPGASSRNRHLETFVEHTFHQHPWYSSGIAPTGTWVIFRQFRIPRNTTMDQTLNGYQHSNRSSSPLLWISGVYSEGKASTLWKKKQTSVRKWPWFVKAGSSPPWCRKWKKGLFPINCKHHNTGGVCIYGCVLKWYRRIIHFNRILHSKPSILGYHH